MKKDPMQAAIDAIGGQIRALHKPSKSELKERILILKQQKLLAERTFKRAELGVMTAQDVKRSAEAQLREIEVRLELMAQDLGLRCPTCDQITDDGEHCRECLNAGQEYREER